ncbi:hypothetical protein KDV27_19590, partial [Morganella morganii]
FRIIQIAEPEKVQGKLRRWLPAWSVTVFCQDVALCDLPESTRLDVRVEIFCVQMQWPKLFFRDRNCVSSTLLMNSC